MIYIALIIMYLTGIFMAVYIGVYHERKKWNKLIDDGILPKPNKKCLES